jgi:hypothetical protein
MAPRKPRKDPKAAANDAEARSKGAPKAKTTKGAKVSPAVAAAKTNPDTDLQAKALFLQNLGKIAKLIKAKDEAVAALRNSYKTAKADGFLKLDFDDAFAIQKAEGEKKKKAAIARSLQIAKWLGCDLGEQLDMFLEPVRMPASDRAYEEGQACSMKGETPRPEYHPSTEQHRKFMEGYHAHQASLKLGKLNPAVAEDEADKAAKKAVVDKQKAEDAAAFSKPSNVVAMTREEADKQKLN